MHAPTSPTQFFVLLKMDSVLQQQKLNEATADDFIVVKLLGVGKHGLVVKSSFKREGLLSNEKFYAIKLLFNFTHEYTSVISNKFENEWLILSRLLPHPNIVRYWSQFISTISPSFIPHIPNEIRQQVIKNTSKGEIRYRSGQFLVFDCYSSTLSQWLAINRSSSICTPVLLLKFCRELLRAINYLHQHNVCHLDLKLDNVLVSDTMSIVVCDFGCAIQFSDSNLELQWIHGLSIGGNRAHLSPEVLTGYHKCRTDHTQKKIHYMKQSAFAVGVLIHEIVTGEHPLDDYPLSYMLNGKVSYSPAVVEDGCKIPSSYPPQFGQIVKGLLCSDESKRMDLSVALNSVEEMLKDLNHPSDWKQLNFEEEIEVLRIDKKFAEVRKLAIIILLSVLSINSQDRIKVIASERDQALKEMKTMAEQCQEIAQEFETLANEYDSTKRQLKEV